MSERKPDKREQKRIDKRNREEEARRAKALNAIEDGMSLRKAAAIVGRSHEYVRYWRDIAMKRDGVRVVKGRRIPAFAKKDGYRELIKVKRPGPAKGTFVKRQRFVDDAVRIKKKYPRMGCRKLTMIGKLGISAPTTCEILKSKGMIEPRGKMKLKGKRFRAPAPNKMWQIDYVDLREGWYLLSVLDDHSGKVLSSDIRRTSTTDDVLEILYECFRKYGKPDVILSDHGVQWYATRGGETRFDDMCEAEGIVHIMGRVNHPQTQGKVERFHGSLDRETDIRRTADPDEKKRMMTEYLEFYNTVRPHWGIDLKTPDSVYYAGRPV